MEKGCNVKMLDVSELTQAALIGQGMRKIVTSWKRYKEGMVKSLDAQNA